jgi:hypothetical protein
MLRCAQDDSENKQQSEDKNGGFTQLLSAASMACVEEMQRDLSGV